MSEAVSSLMGASHKGFVTVQKAGLRGMITLRGDLGTAAVKNAATSAVGVDLPAPGQMTMAGQRGLGWMAPDELLLLVPYDQADSVVAKIAKALKGEHHLLVNVSDARTIFRIEGAHAVEVISKLSPANLSPAQFGPGQMRRSRLAQAAAGFWMLEDGTIEVMCFRSMASYVFDLLCRAADPAARVGFR